MMTRERELLQQARDALDRAISHLAAQPAPVPLTERQIVEFWEDSFTKYGRNGVAFARAIERAHGIAASPEQPK